METPALVSPTTLHMCVHICKHCAANWFSRARTAWTYSPECVQLCTTLMETICARHQNNVLPPFWPTLIAVSGSPTPGMSALSDPRQFNFGGFGNWLKANDQFWSYHIRYRVSHIWHSYCAGHILRRCCYRYFFQRVNCQMPRDFNSCLKELCSTTACSQWGRKESAPPSISPGAIT